MRELALVLLFAAQDSGTLPLGLQEAVERALAHSPRLRALGAGEQAAEAAIEVAEAEERPRVESSFGYTRYSDIPELSFPGPAGGKSVLFPNIPDNFRARVGASYPLYTGGRISALVEAARGEEASAASRLEAARRDLALETRRAYWRLRTASEREEVLARNLEAFEAHVEDAQNRERFGLAARNEVLAVEVERDRAELARIRARADLRLARADLRRLLGLPAEAVPVPTEELVPGEPSPEELESLVALALERRSELQALEASLGAALARARVERSAVLPQVGVGAAYLYAHPNPRFLPPEPEWNDNWELSVSVAVSLFDGGRAAAAEARALAQAEAIRAEVEELEEQVRLSVESAWLEVETARAANEVAARAVAAARESRRVAAERYREGVLPSSELLDAEVALLRAELDWTESLAAERLAAAALERALGR